MIIMSLKAAVSSLNRRIIDAWTGLFTDAVEMQNKLSFVLKYWIPGLLVGRGEAIIFFFSSPRAVDLFVFSIYRCSPKLLPKQLSPIVAAKQAARPSCFKRPRTFKFSKIGEIWRDDGDNDDNDNDDNDGNDNDNNDQKWQLWWRQRWPRRYQWQQWWSLW